MKLGELLLAAGVIDETRLQAALAEQKKWGGKLGRTLVDLGFLSEELMVKALSRQLGIPECKPDVDPLPPGVTEHLGVQFCERYGVMPISADASRKVLHLATSDPTNYKGFDEISFKTGHRVEPVVATGSSVDRAIRKYYYGESIVASDTAHPSDFGSRENVIDFGPTGAMQAPSSRMVAAPPSRGPGPLARPTPGPGAAGPPSLGLAPARPAAAADRSEVAELRASMERVEKLLAGEVRALRALVETMIDKGVLTREEYLSRVRGRE